MKDHIDNGAHGASVARVTNNIGMETGWPHVVVSWLLMLWVMVMVWWQWGESDRNFFLYGAMAPLANLLVT